MIEHEIKILDLDCDVLIKRLEHLGAEYVHTVRIQDRYYDTEDQTLAHRNERLRIRCQNNSVIITKKTKSDHPYTKSMREDDIEVKNLSYAKKLLEKELGLVVVKYKEKKRITYKRQDCLFDFDYYEGMNPVLEIEGKSPESVQDMVRRLGLHFNLQVKRGSKRLFKHYGKHHH